MISRTFTVTNIRTVNVPSTIDLEVLTAQIHQVTLYGPKSEMEELSADSILAQVVAVDVDEAYMDEKDTFHLSAARPMAYSHGRYYGLGECLGTFGYSVKKTAETVSYTHLTLPTT